jgi:flagellar biosynthesis protein FliR
MSGYEAIFLGFFTILIRTGTAMMVLPGFAAVQVPVRVRLFIALAVSISVFVMLDAWEGFAAYRGEVTPVMLVQLVFTEAFIGLALALPVRLLFLALGFAGETITQFIGANPIPGTPIGDDQPSTTLSAMFNVAAIVLFFASGAHLSFIFALAISFTAYPPGEILSISALTQSLAEDLSAFFNIVLRLSAPIIIYSVIMNLVAGLVNKLTPQIPIYFVSAPFLIFGGLFILMWIGDDMLYLFNVEVNRLMDSLL